MERARDTGGVAITGKVLLVQENSEDIQSGFLMYLPIYLKDRPPGSPRPTTIQERRASLLGYVYSPIRITNLMRATFPTGRNDIAFAVYDGNEISTAALMYDSTTGADTPEDKQKAWFSRTKTIELYGHPWTLVFWTLPNFQLASERYILEGILGAGILISVLAFLFARAQENTRSRAVSLAREMTAVLRETEARFRNVFEQGPLGIALVGLDYRWINVNAALCRMVGYTEAELTRLTFVDITHPDDTNTDVDLADRLARQEIPSYKLEKRYIKKDGEVLWINLTASLVIDDWGKPLYYLSMVEDISERKHAEEALKKSEERFRQVADSADEWIWEVDANGLYTYCSSAVERLLGYSPHELVGKKHFYELFEPSIRQLLKDAAFAVFQQKESFRSFRNANVRKDGKIVVLETSGAPIIDGQGNLRGYLGTDMDVTERLRAAESQELLAAVVRDSADSIVVTDANGIIQYVNPAFEGICGYSYAELIGHTPGIIKSGQHSAAFYEDLWKTIRGGNVWRGRFINKRKDGSLFEEEAIISPIRGADGNVVNFVAVKRDVTKEAQLQRRLMQSQKMEAIGTLAGGIAHDFNNIIFAITGYTELALEELPQDHESRQDLERVLMASKRAGEMVKQILTFSRQDEPERQVVDMSEIITEGLKFLRGSIPATIEVRKHIEPSLGKVLADPTQIHQVLMNLCTNAAHAMKGTKGVLTVELKEVSLDAESESQLLALPPGKYVRLIVSDTGHGIPSDIVQRIFEPYFTTKEVNEGTGLGLSVIHGIVKGHGGAITVYSEPEQGSTFKVYFPVTESEEEAESSDDEKSTPVGTERILIVDDEELLVKMGETILTRLGYEVVTRTKPEDALELFRGSPDRFDLVMTDLTMPKMTGLELATEIKAIRGDIPIILCTGLVSKVAADEAKEFSVQAVIKKPMVKREVAEKVRAVLDGRS
jgi:PAS domain S-box-containing protein